MNARRWLIFWLFCFGAFLGLEIWALYSGTPTLSQTVWNATDAWPLLALVFGLVNGLILGHFFWPRY